MRGRLEGVEEGDAATEDGKDEGGYDVSSPVKKSAVIALLGSKDTISKPFWTDKVFLSGNIAEIK